MRAPQQLTQSAAAAAPPPPSPPRPRRALRLLARRAHVCTTALLVYAALKLAALLGLRSAAAWDRVHRWCARRLLALSRARRGLWVKCCQYVASRGDVLPAAYVDVLSQCLDSCPADGKSVVERIVAEEVWAVCGRRVAEVFGGFNGGECLASASVAGVYRARLRKDGREVVLKVQHPEVGEWLLSDLRDLEWVLGVVGRAEPEFDLRTMLEAWLEKVPGEIDFRCEMQNVIKVRRLLEREGGGGRKEGGRPVCIVPRPVEELTTARMFVMEWVEGCKVTDTVALEAAGVDLERLVVDITRAFALQLIVAGYLHGDLHSGNVLVHSLQEGGAPALLDYGVMVELDDRRRLGFARLIVAAAEGDSFGLLQAFSSMGIELNRADPAASMDLINFLFRATVPREQTLAETASFRDRMLEHRERAAADNDSLRRPLVDSYPGYLIFFLRTLACLRGLATGLGVQHAYLPVLAEYSRRALRDACPVGRRAHGLVYAPSAEERRKLAVRGARLDGWRGTGLRRRLVAALEMLDAHGLMVGVQIAVYHKGALVVDIAAGTMGPDNPRPVRGDSLFCGFGASEVLPALLVAQMQDRYGVGYRDTLAAHWPEYGVAGKAATTVGDLLTHGTGLCGLAPPDVSMLRLRDDRRGIVRHLERAEPVHAPGTSRVHRFYDLNFGWLAAELVERVGKVAFPDAVGELTRRLDIAEECYCGNMPVSLLPCTPTSRIATLSNSILEDLCLHGAATAATPPASSSAGPSADSAAGEAGDEASSTTSSYSISSTSTATSGPTSFAKGKASGTGRPLTRSHSSDSLRSVASEISADDADAAVLQRSVTKTHVPVYTGAPNNLEMARSAIESLSASLASDEEGEAGELDNLNSLPHYMLEPTYFNSPALRASCVPSATGHFSARALARLYAVLANDGEVDGVRVLAKGRVAKMMSTTDHGVDEGSKSKMEPAGSGPIFAGGLRLYDVERKSGRVQGRAAIGQAGLGGTMGFAIPGEHQLAVAVTVNKLNVVSAASALAVFVVCKVLDAPVPLHIARMERRAREIMERDGGNDLFAAVKSATVSDFAQALAG